VTKNDEDSIVNKRSNSGKHITSGLSSSKDVTQEDISNNFILIFSNKTLLQNFEDFLTKSYSHDYLNFYQDIIRYQNGEKTFNPIEKKNLALEIQSKYGIGTQPIIVVDDIAALTFVQNLNENNLDGIFNFFFKDVESVLTTKYLEYVNESK